MDDVYSYSKKEANGIKEYIQNSNKMKKFKLLDKLTSFSKLIINY